MSVDYPNATELVNNSACICCIRWLAWFWHSIILVTFSVCVVIWDYVVTVGFQNTRRILYVHSGTQDWVDHICGMYFCSVIPWVRPRCQWSLLLWVMVHVLTWRDLTKKRPRCWVQTASPCPKHGSPCPKHGEAGRIGYATRVNLTWQRVNSPFLVHRNV